MKPAPFNLLMQTASKHNILTLTTKCSTSCVFCSHKQNPKEIEAYYVRDVSIDDAHSMIEFLDKNRKIVIGESATRICEGEPFLYKHIMQVLKIIRQRFPSTAIQITTSGVPLKKDIVEELYKIGGIELNVSLNSCSEEGRKALYSGKTHMEAVQAVKCIYELGIPYNGSIVAMPHLIGWEDVESTVEFLSQNGANTIRIFMPGYTKYYNVAKPPKDIREYMENKVYELRNRITTPITMEPAFIKDLSAEVEGVMPGSAAQKAGILKGDVILNIDNKAVTSRVDAYYKFYNSSNPIIDIIRNTSRFSILLEKKSDVSSGMVFNYDIHPQEIFDINRIIGRYKGKRCLILTSELGYNIISKIIFESHKLKIHSVENDFFGGNIMCAGLLTLHDIERHLKGLISLPEAVLLPSIMFDMQGRDLTGRHYMELERDCGIDIEII